MNVDTGRDVLNAMPRYNNNSFLRHPLLQQRRVSDPQNGVRVNQDNIKRWLQEHGINSKLRSFSTVNFQHTDVTLNNMHRCNSYGRGCDSLRVRSQTLKKKSSCPYQTVGSPNPSYERLSMEKNPRPCSDGLGLIYLNTAITKTKLYKLWSVPLKYTKPYSNPIGPAVNRNNKPINSRKQIPKLAVTNEKSPSEIVVKHVSVGRRNMCFLVL